MEALRWCGCSFSPTTEDWATADFSRIVDMLGALCIGLATGLSLGAADLEDVVFFDSGLICIMLWALRRGLSSRLLGILIPEYFAGGLHFPLTAESSDFLGCSGCLPPYCSCTC